MLSQIPLKQILNHAFAAVDRAAWWCDLDGGDVTECDMLLAQLDSMESTEGEVIASCEEVYRGARAAYVLLARRGTISDARDMTLLQTVYTLTAPRGEVSPEMYRDLLLHGAKQLVRHAAKCGEPEAVVLMTRELERITKDGSRQLLIGVETTLNAIAADYQLGRVWL